MIKDQQVKKLRRDLNGGKTLAESALRSGMSEKTARKYRAMNRLPSESKTPHDWRTRTDPFEDVWEQVKEQLSASPGLQAKTIFESLQRQHPEQFQDGQLRTLQRHIKQWRATEGPAKEVYFDQVHHPGDLCASDFTRMGSLGITIAGQPFDHLLYHFVLTYSNWESVSLCYSESFESLSDGFQDAISRLAATPIRHRTDRLSAAVNNLSESRDFTARYQGLMDHYGIAMEKINPRRANENGDAESSHGHLKKAIEQALLLRGSHDFQSTELYMEFVNEQVAHRNAGRSERFAQEQAAMPKLGVRRLDAFTKQTVRVNRSSLLRVQGNVYSVHSRLIGEQVEVRIFAGSIEVWYAQKKLETLPRLRGRGRHEINYRHIIDWLIRKPGAFADYRYRDALFPNSRFRMAFDALNEQHSAGVATKFYLQILQLAARENETGVDLALRQWIDGGAALTVEFVQQLLLGANDLVPARDAKVAAVDLSQFDSLLGLFNEEPVNDVFVFNFGGNHDTEVSDEKETSVNEQISVNEQEIFSAAVCGERQFSSEHSGSSGTAAQGVASADVPGSLSGSLAAGSAGVAQLRAVSVGACDAGVRDSASQSDGGVAPAVEVAQREDVGEL